MNKVKLSQRILCSWLGWHNDKGGVQTFDGASFGARCGRCGVRVLQDSQGNWFEV